MSTSRPATPITPAAAPSPGGTPEPGQPAGPAIDQAKLDAFLGKVVADWGATASAALVVIGDRLGLYKAMAGADPLTPAELARRTGTAERYVREWLLNQAAGGYVAYEPATGRYRLPPEQALALADEDGPAFVAGGFEIMTAILRAEPQVAEAFRTGRGLPWADHAPGLFDGTERFFRRAYRVSLVAEWLPALGGVVPKLEAGARVADVGCGYGAAAILLAQAYPRARVDGYDSHVPSVERARRAAADAGVAGRTHFEVAGAAALPAPADGAGYDLVAYFDSFHDMGDPVRVARRAREVLAPDGAVLLVEPMAGDRVEDNLTPFGRLAAAASTLVCTPNALNEGDTALGQLYADGELQAVFQEAGFRRFRRAAQTPFNRVFEARP